MRVAWAVPVVQKMSEDSVAEGFLGRWSERKQAQRAGQPLADTDVKPKSVVAHATAAQVATVCVSKMPADGPPVGASAVGAPAHAQPEAVVASAPAPTLDDVKALTPDDSFARFVAPDVSPTVRNAAMKKLFADPHYNLMDGLDIYIDDYSLPSPLPATMLQKMASAQFMKLVDEPETPAADNTLSPALLPNPEIHHDHPDLRLQPDHAAGRALVEREPEPAADAAQQPVPPPGG
ncbi:MAG: DUF3306 domain-containing protein [Rhodoferax sp.]|nr:DUF3306 domain-containing protein [Rhodoferax sp.]